MGWWKLCIKHPPITTHDLVWLFEFNSVDIIITTPPSKLAEIADLVAKCTHISQATLHQLRVLLSKLLNILQCFVLPRFFFNRMLAAF